ncbi:MULTISPECIES: DUF397 domain-containing protein [Streptomyces]|uniref:DUF397 domain-containing protein n=1 Tax=Streptomyces sudanensis TaxID=436397 RepID=A0ABY4TEB5_9ACTN|nr:MULTISPECIES: DUF397 domain-containing protein [Streptomyces]URN17062.1 DUF397 domain-containing protein [Streptomyces sudanensis]
MNRTPRPDPNGTTWRKSSYSNQEGGDCVEVADGFRTVVPVRDSKTPHSPALCFATTAWTTFIDGLKSGHDRI